MTNAFSLEGRAALVTGSSQGIGHAIGMGLRDAGARVVFHGLQERPDSVPQDAASVACVPHDAAYVACDLSQPDSPASLVSQAFAAEPSLDMLVCNAGSFF